MPLTGEISPLFIILKTILINDDVVYCWPSPSGNGTCDVNIEYGLQTDKELYDVVIAIPFPWVLFCAFPCTIF
jgi:hypothetical protein